MKNIQNNMTDMHNMQQKIISKLCKNYAKIHDLQNMQNKYST